MVHNVEEIGHIEQSAHSLVRIMPIKIRASLVHYLFCYIDPLQCFNFALVNAHVLKNGRKHSTLAWEKLF